MPDYEHLITPEGVWQSFWKAALALLSKNVFLGVLSAMSEAGGLFPNPMLHENSFPRRSNPLIPRPDENYMEESIALVSDR
ncbi:hypothetical protein [Desulfonatronum parangueonense]